MGPMSLLRTTAATHRLSADKTLPGLGTRRRVPTVDMRAHTPQSLLLPAGCCACAARAVASRCSARGHPSLWPLGAMRIVRAAMSQVCGHRGGAPDTAGWPSGSTVNCVAGARRWCAVQCRMLGVSDLSRYTASKPPSSTYLAMRRAAGVWSCRWPSHPSLGSNMAWGARHCTTSAASATTSSLSSTPWSAATRKWCLGVEYRFSRAPRNSASRGEASPQSRSQGSAPGRCRPAPPGQTAALRTGRSRQTALATGSRQGYGLSPPHWRTALPPGT